MLKGLIKKKINFLEQCKYVYIFVEGKIHSGRYGIEYFIHFFI